MSGTATQEAALRRLSQLGPGLLAEPLALEGVPDDIHALSIRFDLDRDIDPSWLGMASAAERARAERFVQARDRIRFLGCRAALRITLGTLLGVAPEAVAIATSRDGRPELAVAGPRPVDFNLSHSAERGLIVWSAPRRVGVDVEHIDTAFDWRELGHLVFGRDDRQRVESCAGEARARLSYEIWSTKEAVLKADGSGLTAGLTDFSIRDGRVALDETATGPRARRLPGYRTRAIPVAPGYAAAIAWSDEPGSP
jgi:4'-phosphopantetheinyl transferase